MTPKDKLFTPDLSKHKYTIQIKVYENCAELSVNNVGTYLASYYEVIGALETQKNHIIFTQREKNIKTAKRKTK